MKKILLIAFLSFFQMNVSAQPKAGSAEPPMEPREFQLKMRQEMSHVAGFTSEEEEAFFTLYTEMREKQHLMGRQIHELKKAQAKDAGECAANIARIKQMQVEMSQLEQTYYRRILKAVPAEKVWVVMKVEDEFHRRMVRGKRQRQ